MLMLPLAAAACIQVLVSQVITEIPPSVADALIKERQVRINDLPYQHIALNPSMVKYHGQTIMIYRRDLKPDWLALETKLAMVVLDDEFQPIQPSQLLDTRVFASAHHAAEDPRLFVYRDELYVLFNQTPDGSSYGIRRIYLGKIHVDYNRIEGFQFEIAGFSLVDVPGGNQPGRDEKNWVPLIGKDSIRIAYNANPPQVYRLSETMLDKLSRHEVISLEAELYAAEGATQLWRYGEIRGGTPAVQNDDGDYLAFFHAYLYGNLRNNTYRRNYFMGLYAFEGQAPYAVKAITKEPLLPPSYTAPQYKDLIIFPGGFFIDGDVVHVTYGICDEAVYVADFDKHKLFALMTPVAN
jgi:hypothetical protein